MKPSASFVVILEISQAFFLSTWFRVEPRGQQRNEKFYRKSLQAGAAQPMGLIHRYCDDMDETMIPRLTLFMIVFTTRIHGERVVGMRDDI